MADLGQTTQGGPRYGTGKVGNIDDREDRLLPWRSVRDITGISRTTAWRMQQTGDFPSPVPVSAKRVGWWESELTAWKARRRLANGERPRTFIPANASRPSKPQPEPKRLEVSVAPVEVPAATVTTPVMVSMQRRTRTKAVSPDQIDFGF